MWLDRIKEIKKEKGLSAKSIAEAENMSVRSVERVLNGETPNPGVDTIRRIIHAIGSTWSEIFAESGAVIGGQDLATAQADIARLTEENEKLTSLLQIANIDLTVQKDKITALEAETKLLNLRLEYEQKINAVHNYYNKL
jgi:transcriptional regulator with XRE-family HTH domain